MEMTKERLASYRSNRQEIAELDWMLNNRWKSESMIGNDVVFDYSKGYPMPQSVVGFDQKKYERLQNRDLNRKTYLEKENEEIEDFVSQITDSLTRRIFIQYYINGDKPVNQSMISKKVHIDRSRISRRIDEYLKNAQKAQKAHV